jgi:hypothetical protein
LLFGLHSLLIIAFVKKHLLLFIDTCAQQRHVPEALFPQQALQIVVGNRLVEAPICGNVHTTETTTVKVGVFFAVHP